MLAIKIYSTLPVAIAENKKTVCITAVKKRNIEIEDLTIAAEKQEETPKIEPEPAVVQREVQEKQKESPIIEPEPAVIQKEVEPAKQPEPEEILQEENKKIPIPAVAATTSKEITTSGNEIQTKQKGISIIALAVLAIGLVVGVILVAVGLGFGGIFGYGDGLAKAVTLAFGALVISLSIIVFFAKK